jgi:hypothetical protein
MWVISVPIVGYWPRTRQAQSGSHRLALLMKWGCPLDVLLSGQGEPREGVESCMPQSGGTEEHLSIGGEHAPHHHCFEMTCHGGDWLMPSLSTRFPLMTNLLGASVCDHRCWDAEPGDPVGQKCAAGASILPGEVLLATQHHVWPSRDGGSGPTMSICTWLKGRVGHLGPGARLAVLIPGCDDIPCQAMRKEIRLSAY